MALFTFGLVVLLVGLTLLAVRVPPDRARSSVRPARVVLPVLGVLLVVASAFTIVGTRNVGVVTTFGKPTGRTLANGLHVKAPWQKVTDIDGTIETQKFVGRAHCIDVRISDGSTACISVVIRSRIDKDHADDIYADYRNSEHDINDNVNDALVRTQLTSALATTFTDFNPLLVPGSVQDAQRTEQAAPDLQSFSKDARSQMTTLLDQQSEDGRPQVDITSITISYIYLSENTQTRLNQLQSEVANTRIAKQKQATAAAQAAANKALAASVAQNPNVLVAQCFDTLQERTEKGLSIPAGFSCWPGGTSATAVVPVR